MPVPEFSQEASDDVDAIVAYIAKSSPANAVSMLETIIEAGQMLAENPDVGEVRDGIGVPGCRSFTVSRYVVFFRPSSSGVEVARIIDGSRDM